MTEQVLKVLGKLDEQKTRSLIRMTKPLLREITRSKFGLIFTIKYFKLAPNLQPATIHVQQYKYLQKFTIAKCFIKLSPLINL